LNHDEYLNEKREINMLTNSQKNFIKKHYKKMRTCDIAKKLNLSSLEVSKWVSRRRLISSWSNIVLTTISAALSRRPQATAAPTGCHGCLGRSVGPSVSRAPDEVGCLCPAVGKK